MHRFITRYLLANIFNNKLYMSLSFVSKVGLGALMTAGVMSTTIIGNPGKRSSASRVVIDTVREMNPPFLGFYTKYLDCDNIIIRSASVVDDKAFYIASAKIKMMLEHMPMAHKNLVKNGAELHIIGKDQVTSDLPELADQKGVSYVDNGVLTDIDRRTRGVGGLCASCGEENLLQLPNDRYFGGSDICVHEFAHTIMNYGFDVALRQKIQNQYERSIASGLWKGAYSATDDGEYWAELSMWYFGKHGEFLHGTRIPEPGADGLKNYDIGGYKLLDSIYSGLLQPTLTGRATVAVQKGAVSGASLEKTEFAFTNERSTAVKVYWIDWSGNAKLYATVPPKGHIVQPTFVSHVWMFENDKGEAIVYLRVNDPPCNIELKD